MFRLSSRFAIRTAKKTAPPPPPPRAVSSASLLLPPETIKSLTFCAACRRDFSVVDNTDNKPHQEQQRDFFASLEHNAFVHLVEMELMGAVVEDQKSSNSSAVGVDSENEQAIDGEQSHQNNHRPKERLDAVAAGVNARLLSLSVISYLDLLSTQQEEEPFHVHLCIVQDAVDVDSEELVDRLVRHVRGVVDRCQRRKRQQQQQQQEHHQQPLSVVVLMAFFVGAKRAKGVSELVIAQIQEQVADLTDNNCGSLVFELRATLICPPNSTASVEKTSYCLVEVLSTLSQCLFLRRCHGGGGAVMTTNKKRQQQQQQLSVAVATDHAHIWQNVKMLYSASRDFEFERV